MLHPAAVTEYKQRKNNEKTKTWLFFERNQLQEAPKNNSKTKKWLLYQHFIHKSTKKQPTRLCLIMDDVLYFGTLFLHFFFTFFFKLFF